MELVEIVDRFYTPPLCLFGAIGNCLSVYVFCMTSGHRSLSSSYYLSALAISDIGFLINLFAVWLTGEGYEVITTRLSCPLIMYLGQVTCFLSVWFIVAFTCERFCAVCYPLTRPAVCTVARAKKVIGFITVVALVAFSYVWIIAAVIPVTVFEAEAPPGGSHNHDNMEIGESVNQLSSGEEGKWEVSNGTQQNRSYTQFVCSVPEEFLELSMMANHLDSFFTFILPFFAITFLNLRITLCVWQLKGQRKTIVAVPRFNRSNSTVSINDRTRILIGPNIRNGHGPHQGQGGRTEHNGNAAGSVGGGCGSCGSKYSHRQLPGTLPMEARKVGTSCSSPPPPPPSSNLKNGVPSSPAEVRVTKTLLLVSTVFLVLNLPSHAIRAFAFVERGLLGRSSEDHSYYVPLLQQWANILFNTNFSVNFLLYCVSGRNFRKSLRNLCCNDDRNGGRTGHKKRRMVPKPFTRGTTGASHHRHYHARNQQLECSSGSAGQSYHTHTHHHDQDGQNEEIDMGELTMEIVGGGNNGLNRSNHSGGNCHHQTTTTPAKTKMNNREMSFYPTSVTEVETYYA